MLIITAAYGVVMLVLGFWGYGSSANASWRILIPAFFGALALTCAGFSLMAKHRKLAMHAAVLVGLIAILAPLSGGILSIPALMRKEEGVDAGPVIALSATSLLSVVYLVLCVRSFLAARKK
jgi:hypothetical protein